jgi:hypothetical protein
VALQDNLQFSGDHPLFNNVDLVSYCDHKHGFLKLIIEKKADGPELTGEYFSIAHEYKGDEELDAVLVERFKLILNKNL